MSTEDEVVAFAEHAYRESWSAGGNVSEQTNKSQRVCTTWQKAVRDHFGSRFAAEVSLNESGTAQKIDLVDEQDRVAYELKSSPNNVHMEIYRDVFKALVFNERNPKQRITTLVFIAPKKGIQKLGPTFPKDVQTISARMDLTLKLRELP